MGAWADCCSGARHREQTKQCRRQSSPRQRWCSQQRLRRKRCRRSRRSRSRWHRHPASTRGGAQRHDSTHCSKQRMEHGVLRPARRPAMWSSMRDHGAWIEPDRSEKVLNQKMCEWGFDTAPRERSYVGFSYNRKSHPFLLRPICVGVEVNMCCVLCSICCVFCAFTYLYRNLPNLLNQGVHARKHEHSWATLNSFSDNRKRLFLLGVKLFFFKYLEKWALDVLLSE